MALPCLPKTAVAQVAKVMHCDGQLKAYGSNGDAYFQFNPKRESFTAHSEQAYAFFIAMDPKRPYVVFKPWLGIHHTLYPENYKKDLLLEVDTDSETYIDIKVTGRRTKIARTLRCAVRIDDAMSRIPDPRSPATTTKAPSAKRPATDRSKAKKSPAKSIE